jgi:hypothetical protein
MSQRLVAPLVAPRIRFWARTGQSFLSWERPCAHRRSAPGVGRRGDPDAARHGHWRGFDAGQHVNVTAEIEGVRVTRSYSPERCPDSRRVLQITGQGDRGRAPQRHLCQARVGDVLELGQAFGAMTLPPSPPRPLLFWPPAAASLP